MEHFKINVSHLSKTFGEHKVLSDINLKVKKGTSLVVIGASGSGKSVLLKTIMGIILPDKKSKILIDGVDVTFLDISERKDFLSKFGMLFQGNALFDSLTVGENITFALTQIKKVRKNQIHKIALQKLEMVGLDSKVLDKYPNEMSGGMQKRIAIARAIATEPEIIFFDEPTSGLDPINSRKISELIASLSKNLGVTSISITHDIKCMSKIADNVILIKDKKIAWSGSNSEIFKTDNKDVVEFIS